MPSSTNKAHSTSSNPNYRIITIESPTSIAAESYRRVKVGLEFSEVDRNVQVIQFCSATQGEGKTLTLLNVAATYAEDEKKVIVVDLDFRRPKLHRAFHLENKDGITDYLAGNIKKEQMIKHGLNGIDLINRGTKAPYPTATLGSDGMKELFSELRKEYDYILVDCPPILAVSDAAIIASFCDGTLFVVNQSKTEKAAAKEAVLNLRQNGVNILGCVFAGILRKNSEYYSSKYKYFYTSYYGKGNTTANLAEVKKEVKK